MGCTNNDIKLLDLYNMKEEEYTVTEIDNSLFTCSKSDFNDFESMERYLDSLDIGLEMKLAQLQKKREGMLNQYKTSSMAYEINSKRRKKEEADMKEQYDKLTAMLAEHERNLRLQVHPMTPDLMLKSDELDKLQETKEVLDDLSKLMTGSNYDSILLLDDASFEKSASKISVLKTVLEEVQGADYSQAKELIDKKYQDLKEKILTKFQAGYWKKSAKQVKDILPLCYRFNLMPEVSDFYIGKVFREVNTLNSVNIGNQSVLQAQIKSLFFLLQRGFKQALQEQDTATNEVNEHQLFKLFGDYSDKILKALINYAFETSIKTSLDNVLRVCLNNQAYLNYLEMFYDQTVKLVKEVESLSNNDSVTHLAESYLTTLYDNYLEQYTYKELGFLEDKYEEYIRDIMKNIYHKMDFGDKRKFQWKKLFQDYKIEQSEKLTAEDMDARINSILQIFMDINLEKIFEITNKSLQRNGKISRYTDRQKQQVRILDLFGREMGQLIINLIKYSGTVVPSFNRKTVLSQQFFELVPQLGTLVQRLELIFQTFVVSKSSLNEAIKLEQQKQDLINKCEKQLQKLLALALSSLLVSQNAIIKETCDYRTQFQGQSASPGVSKVISFASKYLKKIRKHYSQVTQKRILQKMGCQFCDLLIQHFSTVTISKQGLYQILVDLGHLKKFIYEFGSPVVENQYAGLKTLVDMYLLKNDEMLSHISDQKERSLANVSEEYINRYIENKKKNQV